MRARTAVLVYFLASNAMANSLGSGISCLPMGSQLSALTEAAQAVNAFGLSEWTAKGDSLQAELYHQLKSLAASEQFKKDQSIQIRVEGSRISVTDGSEGASVECESQMQADARQKKQAHFRCSVLGNISVGAIPEALYKWIATKQKPVENERGVRVVSIQGQDLQLKCEDKPESSDAPVWALDVKRTRSCEIKSNSGT